MAEQSGSHRIQITIAVISLIGVLVTALLSNWDKIFVERPVAPSPVVVAPTNPSPMPSAPAADAGTTPPPAEAVERLADAQKSVLDESTDTLNGIASKIAGASEPARPIINANVSGGAMADIGGAWRDEEGYQYVIQQQGGDYSFVQLFAGAQVGGGVGKVSGRAIRHGFFGSVGTGECQGQLEPSGTALSGVCGNGVANWAFRVTR